MGTDLSIVCDAWIVYCASHPLCCEWDRGEAVP